MTRCAIGWMVLSVAFATASCGGRTTLVPMHQIGWLSSDAIIADAAGVRVMVRTDAWTGDPDVLMAVIPIEVTIDNRNAPALAISPRHLTMVTQDGRTLTAVPPADVHLPEATAPITDVVERALEERTVAPGDRATGFVYFDWPEEADQVIFRAELRSTASGDQVGVIEIPFHVE